MNDSVLPVVIAALVFLAVALALDGVITWWRETRAPAVKRVRERVERLASSRLSDPLETVESVVRVRPLSHLSGLNGLLERVPGIDSLEVLLLQANLKWTVGRFIGYSISLPVIAFMVIAILTSRIGLAFVIATILAVLPWLFVQRRREARMRRFTAILPEALDSLSRALKAGYSMAGALRVVGDEMPEPLGPEFKQAHDEITYGISPQVALNNLNQRIPSDELKFMIVAILVQRETGGNLAEVLGNISRLMREREKLAAQVRSLSADGRMSALVLCLLPFVTVLIMFLANRKFIEVLWLTRAGQIMIGVAGLMMLTGIVWVRRVVRVKF